MDEGGWMDTHTVCFILQTRRGFRGVNVNRLVAVVRADHGERYEIASCRSDPNDVDSAQALGRGNKPGGRGSSSREAPSAIRPPR